MADGLLAKEPGLYLIKPVPDLGFYWELVNLVETYTGEICTMSNMIDPNDLSREFIGPIEPQDWDD